MTYDEKAERVERARRNPCRVIGTAVAWTGLVILFAMSSVVVGYGLMTVAKDYGWSLLLAPVVLAVIIGTFWVGDWIVKKIRNSWTRASERWDREHA